MPPQTKTNTSIQDRLQDIRMGVTGRDDFTDRLRAIRTQEAENAAIIAQQAESYPTPAELRHRELEEVGQEQDWTDKVKGWIPSPRTTLRVGGGIVGATAAGVPATIFGTPISTGPAALTGSAAGTSIGESLWQGGVHAGLFEDPTGVTQTPQNVALAQAGALATGAGQELLPAYFAPKIPLPWGGRGIPPALRGSAQKSTVRAVNPGKVNTVIAKAREAAAEVLDDIPFVWDTQGPKGLMESFKRIKNIAVEGLEAEYKRLMETAKGYRINSQTIVEGLEKKRDEYILDFATGPKAIPKANPVIQEYTDLIDWFTAHPNFTLTQLRQNRKVWDKMVNWWKTSAAQKGSKEEALEEGANLLRDKINTTFPTIGARNKEVSSWVTLSDLVEKSEAVDWFSGITGDTIPFAVAGAAGGAFTGQFSAWGSGVAAMFLIRALAGTTAWTTASAVAKAKAANLIEKGLVKQAIRLLAASGVQAAATSTPSPASAIPEPLPPTENIPVN
jgi:hypothetical protein